MDLKVILPLLTNLPVFYAYDGILFDHSDELSRQWESRASAAPRPDRSAPEDERFFAVTFPITLERIRTRYADANIGNPRIYHRQDPIASP